LPEFNTIAYYAKIRNGISKKLYNVEPFCDEVILSMISNLADYPGANPMKHFGAHSLTHVNKLDRLTIVRNFPFALKLSSLRRGVSEYTPKKF
jgi:hypothetical protein